MRISDWSSDVCSSDLMLDIDEGQWDRVVDLNLKWTFFAMQAAARAMAARGGSIVNLSSRSGSQPCPPTAHYGAAKAGVDSLTATAAVEWGHLGIRVNAIAPGVVLTENSKTMADPGRRRRQVETVPLQRLGVVRSEEHTSELQSLMRISYAVFCLKNKNRHNKSAN